MHISTFLVAVVGYSLSGLVAADFHIYSYNEATGDSKVVQGSKLVEGEPTCALIAKTPYYRDINDVSGDTLGIRYGEWSPGFTVEIHTQELGHYTWYEDRDGALVDIRDNKVGSCIFIPTEKSYDCHNGDFSYWGSSIIFCTTPLTPQYGTTSLGH